MVFGRGRRRRGCLIIGREKFQKCTEDTNRASDHDWTAGLPAPLFGPCKTIPLSAKKIATVSVAGVCNVAGGFIDKQYLTPINKSPTSSRHPAGDTPSLLVVLRDVSPVRNALYEIHLPTKIP